MNSTGRVDDIKAWLSMLPDGAPITEEELMFCSTYSDVEAWEWIVMGQLLDGRTRFTGPSGLLEKMTSLIEDASRPVLIDRCLEGLTVWGHS
jgi:hypothetical protein